MTKTNKARGGGILRDHQSNLIMAFTMSMIFHLAETHTTLFGLKWCKEKQNRPYYLRNGLKEMAYVNTRLMRFKII